MLSKSGTFLAKVLLFGEYTVLLDGDALAIPLETFSAQWQQASEPDARLIEYLVFLADHETLKPHFDKDRINLLFQNLEEGLILQSNIPYGAGLGSSATVCTAFWQMIKRQDSSFDINAMRDIFSKMESFFHGKSSGVDPLVSYLASPILINKEGISSTVAPEIGISAYLFDSLIPREGKQFINWFTDRYGKDDRFTRAIDRLTLLNNEIINEKQLDLSKLQAVSEIQWEYLGPMIPESIRDIWKDSLRKEGDFCKLCGAGGGGMFLYFSTNSKLSHLRDSYPVYPIL